MKRISSMPALICAGVMVTAGLAAWDTEQLAAEQAAATGLEEPANAAQSGAAASLARQKLAQTFNTRSITFEPNEGQADARIKYLSRSEGYSIGLTERGAVLRWHDQTAPDLQLVPSGASKAGIEAEAPQASHSNYLIGADRSRWHTDVPNYAQLRYRNLYPGIDWVLYGNPQQLEYDFVVAPGADPSRIALDVQGAGRLALDDAGDLLLTVKDHTLRQHKPVIYQTVDGQKKVVEGRYRLKGKQIAFEVGDYDRKRPLIIDPVLTYSTRFGGSLPDQATAIAVDSDGNAYITGWTDATDFPVAAPYEYAPVQSSSTCHKFAYVMKIDPSGTALVYSTYIAGTGGDEGDAIAVDGAGNAYVAGYTKSKDFPLKNALQPTLAGISDAFVAKLNAAGDALIFSTYLGGSGTDGISGIALDSGGDAYVAGNTSSADFPTIRAQHTYGGKRDAFVARLRDDGSALLYSTYLGGSNDDDAWSIAVDQFRNAYVTGRTFSTDYPVLNPTQATLLGGAAAFVSKLGSLGALKYSTYLGGGSTNGTVGEAIAVDQYGHAWVAGETYSTDFPTKQPLQGKNAGEMDGFIVTVR
jgi:hypothetical protein